MSHYTRRAFICSGALAIAWATHTTRAAAATEAGLAALEAAHGGRLGVAALDTESGRRIGYRATEPFPMCSSATCIRYCWAAS
jgi:beta-lactamase class A